MLAKFDQLPVSRDINCNHSLSFWPIPVMSNIEGQVAAELNAPSRAIWFIPAWTLSITVCFMIAYVFSWTLR
jgi:hypothetical protein